MSALAVTGRMIIGIAFGVAYIYTVELSPTILRSNAMSTSSICARVGGVIAPFIGQLVRLIQYIINNLLLYRKMEMLNYLLMFTFIAYSV